MLVPENVMPAPNGAAQVMFSTVVIQQVLGYLGSLAGTCYTSIILTTLSLTL